MKTAPIWCVAGMAVRNRQDIDCVRWLRQCASLRQIRQATQRLGHTQPPCPQAVAMLLNIPCRHTVGFPAER